MPDFGFVGESKARELFGDKRYEATRTNAPAGRRRDLIRLADSVVFGQVYPRPGLTPEQRSLSTVAALTVLGQLPQLRAHVTGALNVGVSEDEIAEVITQMAMYAGFPAALNAMQVADECFDAVATERKK
ncbi:4-carboxymuconolactone decarboxylase [Rhodococcus sp. 27YEA15]|uniref:carboxymuconolactone decarboxylase family protein n=1 Tax=Rhodococcus sp. 27YEA15 TaxID=3156259 RepID=UPI003C7C5DE1